MRMMQVKLRSLTSPPAPPHKDDVHDVELARKLTNSPESRPSVPGLDFPHPVLMSECIELYFLPLNIFLPLLHQPAFERAVADGLHLRDGGFAATLSLVCTIGSRWSTDPTLAAQGLDCGWKWFDQVQLAGKRLLGQANLYDLQTYVLATGFPKGLCTTSNLVDARRCWVKGCTGKSHYKSIHSSQSTMMIQDLGVHRRKAAVETLSAERELQKRALWILVYLDRMASCVERLPVVGLVHSSDADTILINFDVELPLAVDDEYREDPTHPFQQPAGKPSQITFFNMLMTLNHRLGFRLGILYSLKTTRAAMAINDEREA
ncbi:hypothetical protein R3P38DRAFT_3293977 [Favolaschia claudopus]|uniref:Xylanolytic transcriptional activator regulatory domain-containing protein n=1 Tax=Favolaschia claudopus TaxID=2862362 RepID=A0AAV9ZFK0_9AGAR